MRAKPHYNKKKKKRGEDRFFDNTSTMQRIKGKEFSKHI
jgi:hypothetical protein